MARKPLYFCDEWAAERLGSQSWFADRHGYMVGSVKKTRVFMHRLIWFWHYGEWPKVIDHINGVITDNRLANLRSVTVRENLMSRHKPKAHGLPRGVYKSASGRFFSTIWDGKPVHLGTYDTPQEASNAYEAAASRILIRSDKPC